jgi:hypothetical protein
MRHPVAIADVSAAEAPRLARGELTGTNEDQQIDELLTLQAEPARQEQPADPDRRRASSTTRRGCDPGKAWAMAFLLRRLHLGDF